ncbi:6-pyruvoyl tetrahydropterin synthase family protein [Melioribacteraceae bacterium 4301-Me]|uniref:6-pyruvoyl trahydropterin synthase family protein n=1 Tax=Pyranulibacter aquaticus TaxID=3163344 RepID=UPI0035969E17
MMKIAKEFRWEMGHRLPYHNGKCKNLHGHSYKMILEFEGQVNQDGMVIDYFDVKSLINPIVDELDHSVLVYEKDYELIESLKKLNSRFVIVNYHTTAENICKYFLERIKNIDLPRNIFSIRVRIYETENSYAEDFIQLNN